jgi:hypothetical protein
MKDVIQKLDIAIGVYDRDGSDDGCQCDPDVGHICEQCFAWDAMCGAKREIESLTARLAEAALDYDVCNLMRQQAENACAQNGDIIVQLMKDKDDLTARLAAAEAAARWCYATLRKPVELVPTSVAVEAITRWPWLAEEKTHAH